MPTKMSSLHSVTKLIYLLVALYISHAFVLVDSANHDAGAHKTPDDAFRGDSITGRFMHRLRNKHPLHAVKQTAGQLVADHLKSSQYAATATKTLNVNVHKSA